MHFYVKNVLETREREKARVLQEEVIFGGRSSSFLASK